MMNQRYAAIDQGTTGTRVVVFGEDGRHHSPASMPHKQITPNPGWVEHDATEILANIRRCLSQCDMVDAIGLGHQGESLLASTPTAACRCTTPSFGKISAPSRRSSA